jgi:hypothetical protein
MALSNAQRAQVMMWLEKNSLATNCPLCADIAWELADFLQGTPHSTQDGDQPGVQAAHPMVQAVCTSCGYVLLLSARVLGLTPET